MLRIGMMPNSPTKFELNPSSGATMLDELLLYSVTNSIQCRKTKSLYSGCKMRGIKMAGQYE